jgi:hypothetical protein
MPPAPPISKTVRVFLALGYLLGLFVAFSFYWGQRDSDGFMAPSNLFIPLAFLVFLITGLLVLGSLWFWRWSTAKAFILMLFINTTLAFVVICIAQLQSRSELKQNLARAETFIARIESYHQANGHYPAAWADLGLTSAPVLHRGNAPVPINYTPETNATYSLYLPYGWYIYYWDPATRQWGVRD